MEPSFRGDDRRSLDLLILAAAVVLLILTGYALLQQTALWIPVLGLVALVLLALAYLRLRGLRRSLRLRVRALEHSLIGQSVTDNDTGAALPQWFAKVMDTECRRAVRDFAPLTLMQLEIKGGAADERAALRVRLARMLTSEISRPGDLVGLSDLDDLSLLLPSTNENAEMLAKRCIEHAVQLLDTDSVIEVRLAACTLQPKADLSPEKVKQQLEPVLEEVRGKPPGSFVYRAEPTGVEAYNQAYTL